jgi:hypothetical protein
LIVVMAKKYGGHRQRFKRRWSILFLRVKKR